MKGTELRPPTRADIARLIELEYWGLRRLIVRQTRDTQIASDILNEASRIAWEKWLDGKLERPAEIAGYIFQVAGNLLRNRRRVTAERPDCRVGSEVLETMIAPDQTQDEVLEAKIAIKVRSIVSSMRSNRDRAVLVRFYLHEEDKESICRDLGLRPEQFTKVLHRARGRLRQLLEADGVSELIAAPPTRLATNQ